MKRNRSYCRQQRYRTSGRKSEILKRIGEAEYVHAWTRGKWIRLAKGKIHCSSAMCRSKSYDSYHIEIKSKWNRQSNICWAADSDRTIGGGGENRTPVRKPLNTTFSGCSTPFWFPYLFPVHGKAESVAFLFMTASKANRRCTFTTK